MIGELKIKLKLFPCRNRQTVTDGMTTAAKDLIEIDK